MICLLHTLLKIFAFCVTSSGSHIILEKFSCSLLYNVASVHWSLWAFIHAQLCYYLTTFQSGLGLNPVNGRYPGPNPAPWQYELSIMAGQVRTAIQHLKFHFHFSIVWYELELLCSIMFLTYKSCWASLHNLCPLVHCLSMQRTVVTQNSPLKFLPWQAAEPWMNGWTWASAALPAWHPFLWNSQGKRMQCAIFIPPWLST